MGVEERNQPEVIKNSIIKIFEYNGHILSAVARMDYGVAGVFQKQKEFHMKNLTAEFVRLKAIHENQSLDLIPQDFLLDFTEIKNQL